MTKKNLGLGATCTVSYCYVHPASVVKQKFPNARKKESLTGLVCLRKETKKVNNKFQECAIIRHEEFASELHVVLRWVKVDQEGQPFEAAAPRIQSSTSRELPAELRRATAQDIKRMRDEGFEVDDDNDPAPENVPDGTTTGVDLLNDGQEWKKDGLCGRKKAGVKDFDPALKGDHKVLGMDLMSLFKLFFPFDWLQLVLLININKNINGEMVSLGEMLRWIGLWYYMATFKGFSRNQFWSAKEIDDFEGAPVRLSCWMSMNRFNKILAALKYTDEDLPTYSYPFHQVRQVIRAWNENMEKIFRPGWISCLDESMSPWSSKWTCPGWMFVPRKPHPMGNEYHSVCCGLSGVMWAIELVEGRDAPPERTGVQFAEKPKTVALLLRLCSSIFGSGNVIILDSGFCSKTKVPKCPKKGAVDRIGLPSKGDQKSAQQRPRMCGFPP
jgi:hypothetical protein